MKTTVDTPEAEIEELRRFTGAATTREAIVMAVAEYNRRCRMAALAEHGGQGKSMMTPEQLHAQRRKG